MTTKLRHNPTANTGKAIICRDDGLSLLLQQLPSLKFMLSLHTRFRIICVDLLKYIHKIFNQELKYKCCHINNKEGDKGNLLDTITSYLLWELKGFLCRVCYHNYFNQDLRARLLRWNPSSIWSRVPSVRLNKLVHRVTLLSWNT